MRVDALACPCPCPASGFAFAETWDWFWLGAAHFFLPIAPGAAADRRPRRRPNCGEVHEGRCSKPNVDFKDRTCWTCGGTRLSKGCME